jgi:hypothetical protein
MVAFGNVERGVASSREWGCCRSRMLRRRRRRRKIGEREMRRWLGVAVSVLLMALLLACGSAGGADGNLTDDWAAIPTAHPLTPQPGVCHRGAEKVGYLTSYAPVDCAQAHQAETVHVGTFPPTYADRSTPPTVGSTALRAMFADCDIHARQFVSGDWRGARLSLQVVPPSPQGWAGGSRWYRCDLFVLDAFDGAHGWQHSGDLPVDHTGTLRGLLTRPSPLAYGCFNDNEWNVLLPMACDKPHEFEYVGIWTTPLSSLDEVNKHPDRGYNGCRPIIANYAHLPNDATLWYRTGTTYRAPTTEAWARGDRGVRCFMWPYGRTFTRSLKAAGPTALPIQ